jgi:hypothetical protein
MFSLPLPSDGAEAAGAIVPGKGGSVIVDIDDCEAWRPEVPKTA